MTQNWPKRVTHSGRRAVEGSPTGGMGASTGLVKTGTQGS